MRNTLTIFISSKYWLFISVNIFRICFVSASLIISLGLSHRLPSQENRANNQENLPLKEEEIVIEEGIDLNVVLPFNETISVSNIKAVIIENDEKEIEVEKETEIVKVAKAKPIKLKVKLKGKYLIKYQCKFLINFKIQLQMSVISTFKKLLIMLYNILKNYLNTRAAKRKLLYTQN